MNEDNRPNGDKPAPKPVPAPNTPAGHAVADAPAHAGAPVVAEAPAPMEPLPLAAEGPVQQVDGLLARFFGYPLLTAQIVLYALIAWGLLGDEFGLSDLFWHEDPLHQAACGAATCWLFGTIVFVNMLLVGPRGLPGQPSDRESSDRYGGDRTLFPSRNPGVRWAGVLMVRWLLFFMFAVWLVKVVAVLRNECYVKPEGGHPFNEFWHQWFGFPFLVGYFLSFTLAVGVSALARVTEFRDRLTRQTWYQRWFDDPSIAVPTEPEEAGRGVRTALPATEVPLRADDPLRGADDRLPADTTRQERVAAYNLRTLMLLHAMAAFCTLVIAVLLFLALAWIASGEQLPPLVILSLLLMFLDVVGGLIAFRVSAPRTLGVVYLLALFLSNWVLVVVCAFWVVWGLVGDAVPAKIRRNRWYVIAFLLGLAVVTDDHILQWTLGRKSPVTNTYDNIAGPGISYDNPLPLSDTSYRDTYRQRAPADGLIASKSLLETFGKKSLGGKPKPRLVVVAVSGGGIRAAVWTGVVLEGLEEEFDGAAGKPNIRDHIRIFAGSSGGMVGTGAYAADFEDKSLANRQVGGRNSETGLLPLSQALATESLSSVVQTMVVRDFTWDTVFPHRTMTDRGRTLEEQWNRNFIDWPTKSPFARSIRSLRDKEAKCERPSLIFSPTMVEDSKRLLISNLDLDVLTHPAAHRPDKPNPSAPFQPADLSLPAVEFFRLFPDSDKFTVGSAARMSASFPILSPAVAIPVTPQRRVVDAGYFDNYGIDILANWLLNNREYVAANTSGVLLIQIRAYPLDKGGRGFEDESPSPVTRIVGAVSAPLQAVLTARGSAAYHRNNEMLAELHRAFNTDKTDKRLRDNFFTTVVFEQQQDAALSWYLTTAQKKQVADGFYMKDGDKWTPRVDPDPDKNIRAKLDAVKTWMTIP